MIISVGGYAGSGTTTLCRKIKDAFGLQHVYAGLIFREMAQKRGISLQEFSKEAEQDETIDLEVDRIQKERAEENSVVEGRISAYLIDAGLKIWLSASRDVRARRVAQRETITYEEAAKRIAEREKSEKKRYKMYYQIDTGDLSVYDLVMNTELWDAEGVFKIVKAAIEVRAW